MTVPIAARAATAIAVPAVMATVVVARAATAVIAVPRRERSEGGNDDGPAPEFAPAFLKRDDD